MQIIHNPLGQEHPYEQLPEERFPRQPFAEQPFTVGIVTRPVGVIPICMRPSKQNGLIGGLNWNMGLARNI
jgi:hypothetical protein